MQSKPGDQLRQILAEMSGHLRLLKQFGINSLPVSKAVRESKSDPTALTGDKHKTLAALESDLAGCTRCSLHQGRNQIVFGQGNADADLVLVGEAPGFEEDRQGLPFVGPAGQLLERILKAMGLSREQVYICNVVKCRPPNNHTPDEQQMRTCGQFLHKQVDIISPKAIICLGSTAAHYLLNTDKSVSALRGRFYKHTQTQARMMVTYHPAYLLRNQSAKKLVWQDVQKVMAELELGQESWV